MLPLATGVSVGCPARSPDTNSLSFALPWPQAGPTPLQAQLQAFIRKHPEALSVTWQRSTCELGEPGNANPSVGACGSQLPLRALSLLLTLLARRGEQR